MRITVDDYLSEPGPHPPEAGQVFVVRSPARGEWANREKLLASWDGARWEFAVPPEGMHCFVRSMPDFLMLFDGRRWWLANFRPPALRITAERVLEEMERPIYQQQERRAELLKRIEHLIGGALLRGE